MFCSNVQWVILFNFDMCICCYYNFHVQLSLKDQRDQDEPDDDPTLGPGKIVSDLAKLWRKMVNS